MLGADCFFGGYMPNAAIWMTAAERRRRALGRALVTLFAVALIALLGWVGWGWRAWGFKSATAKGLQNLADLHEASDIRQALRAWEEETRGVWQNRADEYTAYLLKHNPPSNPHARLLIAQVSGADYGDRIEHWERWRKIEERRAKSLQPQAPGKEAVALAERWKASIGLTARDSTILPIDGHVYIGSLGATVESPDDSADGVVRVDGANGAAETIFQSPDKGLRDVVGMVAGNQELIVACRNGHVYGIDSLGKLVRWKAPAGGKIASLPLGIEINNDSNLDAVVVTENGKVVALGGGRTLWSVALELPAKPKFDPDLLDARGLGAPRASLAFGPLPGTSGPAILVTTWGGLVVALAPTTGKTIWSLRLPNGIAAPALLLPPEGAGEPGAYIIDATGMVWSLLRGDRKTTAKAVWSLGWRQAAFSAAALRTTEDADGAVGLLAVATDIRGRDRSSLCWLGAEGIRWRCPIDGIVRCAPAVADLNGDGAAEALVVSSLPIDGAGPRTLLTIVSATGHILRNYSLDAAVEATPVVADVDRDGMLDVLIADRDGELHCYATEKFGAVYWGLAAGDPRAQHNANDAFTFGQTPNGYQWLWKPGRPRKK